MKQKLPQFMQSALWSYDIEKFNPDDSRDKKIIIENTLNHGTDEQIQWVLQYYPVKNLRMALRNPSRGSWNPRSLFYWTKVLELQTQKKQYAEAINSLYIHAAVH